MIVRALIPFLISISLFFVSCEADINLHNISNEVSLHPDMIFPIGGASITLGQIITRNDTTGKFVIGNDAEINYVSVDNYEFKFPVIDFLKNTHELLKNQYPSPTGVMFIPSNYTLPTISSTDSIVLGNNSDKNGDRIDSLMIKSATITVIVNVSDELKSVRPSDITFSIVFPNGKIQMADGSSSTISFTPSGYGLINTVLLKNFMMKTSVGGSAIPVEIKVNVKSGDAPLTISPASYITSRINFTQLDYSVAYGIFKSGFNLPTIIEQNINYSKDMPSGFIKPTNPQVCISTISNIGTYLNLKIDWIKAFLSTNLNALPVFANFNGNKFTNIEMKQKPVNPGETINFNLPTLNNSYGGTSQLFESSIDPDKLQYNFSVSVDSVLNNRLKTPNYITSDASIKVNIKTIIPMDFTGSSYYEYRDSIPNVFALISTALNQTPYNNISSTALILNVSNGLPVRTTFTFNLMDSVGMVIPTTFIKSYVIGAGKTDVNGIVQPGQENKQTLQVTVDKDQLPALRKARSIIYTLRIEGSDTNSNIHFTKTNTFDVKVGLFVKGEINTTIGTQK